MQQNYSQEKTGKKCNKMNHEKLEKNCTDAAQLFTGKKHKTKLLTGKHRKKMQHNYSQKTREKDVKQLFT